MAGWLRQGDLLAGGVAAAALSLLVFAFDVTPWLAIPLALATYSGVVLLRPRTERQMIDDARRQHLTYQTALANAGAIRALQPRLTKPAVREHVARIADQIDRVLAVMREDRNLAAAPLVNEQLLEPFGSLLTQYVRLSTRGIKSADGLLEKTETRDLPMIEQAVGAFYEKLHRADVIDLAALGDVLEFNLETVAATTPRRSTR